jgi:DNA mismatch repair protein MutL
LSGSFMASRIKLLPENLINRIAAGEVVERPASVLKELLENSLDAGATRIEVDLEAGGKKLIRVTDNGHGLNREELFLCLERHATSKIASDSDLFTIHTLGFRGEALPSIASVSKMTITSQVENEPGHTLKVAGGKILDLSPAATNQGTVIEVRDLFYNVPARLKFLKTEATETAHLIEVTQRYALSRTNLRLRVRDGGREILSVDERNDVAARAMKILGREAAASLRRFAAEKGDLKIEGYLSGPEASKTTSSLFVFVSGRPVRDKLLTKAVIQGYGRTLPNGRFPTGVIFIDLDPTRVDVNVHPAKTEVRFREPGIIFEALRRAVSGAIDVSPLAETDARPSGRASSGPSESQEFFLSPDLPRPVPPENLNDSLSKDPDRRLTRFSMGRPSHNPKLNLSPPTSPPPWMVEEVGESLNLAPKPSSPPTSAPPTSATLTPTSPLALSESPRVQVPPPSPEASVEGVFALAQLHYSYILAQGPKALYIVDQHAAHERILFNQMRETLKKNGLPSQGLVLPQNLELDPQESLAAEKLDLQLKHLGFRLEPFGERVHSLRGVPCPLTPQAAREALLEILGTAKKRLKELDGAGLERVVSELSDSWLYSLACRAAVKAGDPLNHKEMESLLTSLAKLGAGGYCPHGRPSTVVISLADLAKRFGRT